MEYGGLLTIGYFPKSPKKVQFHLWLENEFKLFFFSFFVVRYRYIYRYKLIKIKFLDNNLTGFYTKYFHICFMFYLMIIFVLNDGALNEL
jgi:hypothetical protein